MNTLPAKLSHLITNSLRGILEVEGFDTLAFGRFLLFVCLFHGLGWINTNILPRGMLNILIITVGNDYICIFFRLYNFT